MLPNKFMDTERHSIVMLFWAVVKPEYNYSISIRNGIKMVSTRWAMIAHIVYFAFLLASLFIF